MKRYALFILGIFLCLGTNKAQSSVDTQIAVNDQKDPNTFVLVISNENYKYEQPVPFALNDGSIFKLYCENTLGIPSKNIRYAPDATLNDMRMQLMWLEKVMKAFQGDARAIVYYSGHGMPSEDGKHAYLLPVDGNSQLAGSGLSTESLYKQLGQLPSKGTIVLLDACFSGARRDGKMLASNRGVAIKVKDEPLTGNMVVFSAAQGDETAYPYQEQKHGLFTYYVLSALKEKGGAISLGDLSDQVTKMVTRTSIVENNKSQTPTIHSSSSSTNWRNWRFADKAATRFENMDVSNDTSASTFTPTVDQGSVKPQSLIGTWKSVNDNNGQKIDIFFTFTGSSFTMKNVLSETDPRLGVITFSILIPGDYNLKGNKLIIKSKANKAELKVENMEFSGEAAEKIRQKPELKEQVMTMLEKEIKKSKRKFVSGFSNDGEIPIISLTDTQLIMSLGRGESMTFTRVQ